MCGRYTLSSPPGLVAELFDLDEPPRLEPRYNIAPTQEVPVVRAGGDGSRSLEKLRWGLVPHWAKDPAIGNRMINARSETAADKPAFRRSFRRRRCLLPADGFYEWQAQPGGKQPYLIRHRDRRPFAFAGLWDNWADPAGGALESCTILTREASEALTPVHPRMPVILPAEVYGGWLDPTFDDVGALEELLRRAVSDQLELVAVSRWVNSPANEGPRCIEPVAG